MLGQKLKELREQNQFVQREVAAKLEVDTAYVSKMENGTKQVSRSWLPILAEMFEVQESELITLWIADKIDKIIVDESCGAKALELITKKYTNQGTKLFTIDGFLLFGQSLTIAGEMFMYEENTEM